MRGIFLFTSLMVLLLLVLCGCELSMDDAPSVGKVHILTYGNDYKYGIKSWDNDSKSYIWKSPVYYDDGTTVKYLGSDAYVNNLNKTPSDSTEVCAALVSLAEKCGLEHDEVCISGLGYPSNSEDLTKQRLFDEIETIKNNAGVNDISYFFFSSHGHSETRSVQDYGTDVSDTSYFILKHDSIAGASVVVPVSELLEAIAEVPGIKVILADFCFSGAIVEEEYFSVVSGEYTDYSLSSLLFDSDSINVDPSLFAISASRYYEESYEGTDHGRFTSALLEGLGWDEDSQTVSQSGAWKSGELCFQDLANYIKKNDGTSYQTPMFSSGSNDIILFSF